ncbi:MAG: hypothetical protein ACOC36_05825 [Fibrobacterota bacterium]
MIEEERERALRMKAIEMAKSGVAASECEPELVRPEKLFDRKASIVLDELAALGSRVEDLEESFRPVLTHSKSEAKKQEEASTIDSSCEFNAFVSEVIGRLQALRARVESMIGRSAI